MSDAISAYKATFKRPRNIWEDASIECSGIKLGYRLGQENGFAMICRLLVAQGMQDGGIDFQEIGVQPQYALSHHFDSIVALSLPESEKQGLIPQKEALSIVSGTPDKWAALHVGTKNFMLENGWVEMDGDRPVLTTSGQATLDLFNQPRLQPLDKDELISKSNYDILIAMRDSSVVWDDLYTMSKVRLAGLVNDGNLTEDAHAAIARYEQVIAEKLAEKQAKQGDPQKNTPVPMVSVNQQAAFGYVITRQFKKWFDLHNRTTNSMVKAGWVTVDKTPSLTEQGHEIAVALGLIAKDKTAA